MFGGFDFKEVRVYFSVTLGSFFIEEFIVGLLTFVGIFDKPLLLLVRYDGSGNILNRIHCS
jgi:hypothetical protein